MGSQPEALNKKAIAILHRVRDKLTGRDFPTEQSVDVPAQVDLLIKQSTSHENLCQCYIGWYVSLLSFILSCLIKVLSSDCFCLPQVSFLVMRIQSTFVTCLHTCTDFVIEVEISGMTLRVDSSSFALLKHVLFSDWILSALQVISKHYITGEQRRLMISRSAMNWVLF